jgi:hypothetical protein
MEFKHFKHAALKNGWEFDLLTKRWQLRIAKYQFAFWKMKNYSPVFNFCW